MIDRRIAAVVIAIAIASALLAPGVAAAGGTATLETASAQFNDWLPVIFAALLLAIMFVILYYLTGVLLNNPRVKARALAEFWQVLGTAVMVFVILWLIGVFGSTLTSTKTLAISPTAIESICTANALSQSQFQFTNSGYVYPAVAATATSPATPPTPSPTNLVCQEVKKAESGGGVTTNLDYGLLASYVISANMTNQTLANLDSLYFIEGESGWLRSFKSITTLCSPLECWNPLDGDQLFAVQYTYQPFQAYYFQRLSLPPVEIMASLIFYVFFMQMTFALIMLHWWPYLLAAGILLRAFFFTRRAGGLIIAMVVVALLIYPIIYIFEYTSLSNGNDLCQYGPGGITSSQTPAPATTGTASNCIELIGANSLPTMAIEELPLQYGGPAWSNGASALPSKTYASEVQQYQLNFFNFPHLAWVLNYYGCYPDSSNLFLFEIHFASNYLIPGAGLYEGAKTSLFGILSALFGGITNAQPSSIQIPQVTGSFSCFLPQNFSSLTEAIFNVYGVMGVTGFLIPFFNVLIALSALVGISGMLGGDTNIVGLGRFV